MFIRRETPSDAAVISALHDDAFARHSSVQAQLVDDLRADGDLLPGFSLVAEFDGVAVGHVCCSPADVDGRRVLGLGPLGVLTSHQRSGVGSALMHAVLGAADALDEPAVVLLGSPDYYSQFGFQLAEPRGITTPQAGWRPYLQVRFLTGYDETVRGTFTYAPAFSRLPDA